MLAHSKVVFIQLLYFAHHIIHKCLAERNQIGGLICQILQLKSNLRFQVENRPLHRNHVSSGFPLAHAEKLKVPAEVKDIKFVFVLAVQQSRAKACTAANHLPELCLAHDFLEKHKVQHFGHIDTCVQHIYGNRNLRQFFGVRKFINRALGVGHIVVYDLGIARQMGVFFMEYLQYFFGMGVVLCKDDRLSQLVTVVDFDALGHQGIQHFADRIFVKNPLVQCR